jgi:hypothetical protein
MKFVAFLEDIVNNLLGFFSPLQFKNKIEQRIFQR